MPGMTIRGLFTISSTLSHNSNTGNPGRGRLFRLGHLAIGSLTESAHRPSALSGITAGLREGISGMLVALLFFQEWLWHEPSILASLFFPAPARRNDSSGPGFFSGVLRLRKAFQALSGSALPLFFPAAPTAGVNRDPCAAAWRCGLENPLAKKK
jgi:hypothetical protein